MWISKWAPKMVVVGIVLVEGGPKKIVDKANIEKSQMRSS